MSHARAQIKFKDNSVFYGEYNGTSDIMLPNIYKTENEVDINWRKQKFNTCKDKSHNHEDVIIFSSYGNGFYWHGQACRVCMVLTKNLECDYETEISGRPEWYKN